MDENGAEGAHAHVLDPEQILIDYKNLFWTRLMTIQDYESGISRKYKLGPDIIEECQAVASLSEADQQGWSPLFEPVEFNDEHGPLTIENYRLSQDQLRSWAVRATNIRSSIVE